VCLCRSRIGLYLIKPLLQADIVLLRGFSAQEYVLQTPPLLCNILHNITSYCTLPPSFEVFLRSFEVFLFF